MRGCVGVVDEVGARKGYAQQNRASSSISLGHADCACFANVRTCSASNSKWFLGVLSSLYFTLSVPNMHSNISTPYEKTSDYERYVSVVVVG